jgi:hypothetical protein
MGSYPDWCLLTAVKPCRHEILTGQLLSGLRFETRVFPKCSSDELWPKCICVSTAGLISRGVSVETQRHTIQWNAISFSHNCASLAGRYPTLFVIL